MPGGWDPTIYRVRAEDWQDKADALSAGKERDACIALAEGCPTGPANRGEHGLIAPCPMSSP